MNTGSNTYFPTLASIDKFVDTTSYGGSPVEYPRGWVQDGFTTSLAYATMQSDIDDYLADKAGYESDVAAVKDANELIRPLNWWEMALGLEQEDWQECPTWIGDYTGADMYSTTSYGGYGDPTTGVIATASTNNNVIYGKYGTSTSTDVNIDKNTDLTATRYMMITYYAKGSSIGAGQAVGSASVGTFDSTMTPYMVDVTAPTAETECIGATWIKVGAAAIAVAATLF